MFWISRTYCHLKMIFFNNNKKITEKNKTKCTLRSLPSLSLRNCKMVHSQFVSRKILPRFHHTFKTFANCENIQHQYFAISRHNVAKEFSFSRSATKENPLLLMLIAKCIFIVLPYLSLFVSPLSWLLLLHLVFFFSCVPTKSFRLRLRLRLHLLLAE